MREAWPRSWYTVFFAIGGLLRRLDRQRFARLWIRIVERRAGAGHRDADAMPLLKIWLSQPTSNATLYTSPGFMNTSRPRSRGNGRGECSR